MNSVEYIREKNIQLLPTNSFYISDDQYSSEIISNSSSLTQSELIYRILDTFKPILNLKPSSGSITNTSLSTISCQSENFSNKIYIYFKNKNELGIEPDINDLFEYTKKCSCYRIKIIFKNYFLNQKLSYQQKQSILRIILRREQIFNRYFS